MRGESPGLVPLHPELPVRRVLDSRRVPAGAGGPLPSRNPRHHGSDLRQQLQVVRRARALPAGIDPDLVFKVKAASTRLTDESLAPRGLLALGETADYLYFVMAHDEGRALGDAIGNYATGP